MEWMYTGEQNLPTDLYALEAKFSKDIAGKGVIFPVGGEFIDDPARTGRIAQDFAKTNRLSMMQEYDPRCKFAHSAIFFQSGTIRQVGAGWAPDGHQALAIILGCLATRRELKEQADIEATKPKEAL